MSISGELVDRIGVRLHPARADTATLPVSPGVVREGEFLAAALMLAADIASGIRLHKPDVAATVLTSSFSLRRAPKVVVCPVTATASPLFSDGRRAMDGVEFRGDDGAVVATAHISFVLRRLDVSTTMSMEERLKPFRKGWTEPIQQPLIDAAHIKVVDAEHGHVEMRAADDVRRKIGILQGSIVTLLGEASAVALAEHHFQAAAVVDALDVDFLEAARGERFTTEARWLAEPGTSDIEVVLRDETSAQVLAVFVIGVVRADGR